MWTRLGCCVVAIVLGSCGPDLPSPSTIGRDGGFVRGDGVGVDVPPGALATDVEIRVERIDVPLGYRAAGGAAYRFHPEGIRFSTPVTVRFEVGDAEHDATVFWSLADTPTTVAARSTRVEGDEVVALVDHFSVGFAGWPSTAPSDAGPTDGGPGIADAGTDASPSDASTDASPSDSGLDGNVVDVSGVTCVVQSRSGDCMALPPTTYEDVPFHFAEGAPPLSVVEALSSPLSAFRTLYNTDSPPLFYGDATGSQYLVGAEPPANITRQGLLLTVDVDVSRYGTACAIVDPTVPLIAIQCTGTTLLAAPSCPTFDSVAFPPLSCTVWLRDAACTSTTTTETPRFWLAAGVHGPESELQTDSEALSLVSGSEGLTRFYQEAPCESYVPTVSGPDTRIHREGGDVFVEPLFRESSATCADTLGNPQPLVRVRCSGRTSLSVAP